MSRGAQKLLGQCRLPDGQALAFELWFPHLGVAVDVSKKEAAETDCKRAWCEERFIIFFSADDLGDEEGVTMLADLMRQRLSVQREVNDGSVDDA